MNIPLYVIIGPRNEEDIIYSIVKHYYNQGAKDVFLYDGGSDDNTVSEGKRAGAKIAGIFNTEFYDEGLRVYLMTKAANDISNSSQYDKIWWIFSDADEFLMTKNGIKLREYLGNIDTEKFNTIGQFNYNHFPSEYPYFIRGFHPLDFQPMYYRFPSETETPHCKQGHWKHNTKLWSRHNRDITNGGGFHQIFDGKEPNDYLIIHHFPFREKGFTYKRYKSLHTPNKNGVVRNDEGRRGMRGKSGIRKRWESIDYVYNQQWDKVDNLCEKLPSKGVNLKRWEEKNTLYRWYSKEDLELAILNYNEPNI